MIPDPFYDRPEIQFPFLNEILYYDHASLSPVPEFVRKEGNEMLESMSQKALFDIDHWVSRYHETQELASRLVGGIPEGIAFFPTVSAGIHRIVDAFDWREGDNVIVFEGEFPATTYPFHNLKIKGVEVRTIPETGFGYSLEDVSAQMDGKTRMLCVSAVEYSTGYALDLEALGTLCRSNETLFLVDAIQALGTIPMDVDRLKIDFLFTAGYKWLMSGPGVGFLHTLPENLEKLKYLNYAYSAGLNPFSYEQPHQERKKHANSLEMGVPPFMNIAMMGSMLKTLLDFEMVNIHRYLTEQIRLLKSELLKRGAEILTPSDSPSSIVVFRHPAGAEKIQSEMKRNSIHVSLRRDGIRMAPHFYNNTDHMNRVLDILDSISV